MSEIIKPGHCNDAGIAALNTLLFTIRTVIAALEGVALKSSPAPNDVQAIYFTLNDAYINAMGVAVKVNQERLIQRQAEAETAATFH